MEAEGDGGMTVGKEERHAQGSVWNTFRKQENEIRLIIKRVK